eukprot:1192411-Prorocentrum_minimum.AAC.1
MATVPLPASCIRRCQEGAVRLCPCNAVKHVVINYPKIISSPNSTVRAVQCHSAVQYPLRDARGLLSPRVCRLLRLLQRCLELLPLRLRLRRLLRLRRRLRRPRGLPTLRHLANGAGDDVSDASPEEGCRRAGGRNTRKYPGR